MISKNRVLLADRDADAATSIRDYLEKDGYVVFVAHDGSRGVEMVCRERATVLLLHPSLLGAEGCDRDHVRRAEPEVGLVIFEAAREEGSTGLAGDCSDTVISDSVDPQPPHLGRSVARVRAALREARQEAAENRMEMRLGDLVIDRFRHEVRVGDTVVHLTPTEFRLLEVLAGEAGRAFTRLELLRRVFGCDYGGLERTVDTHVKNLRAKIEPNPADPTYIETVYGIGYRCAGDRSNAAPRTYEDPGVRR